MTIDDVESLIDGEKLDELAELVRQVGGKLTITETLEGETLVRVSLPVAHELVRAPRGRVQLASCGRWGW